MKKLNTIITACFIVVFSGVGFLTTEPVKTTIEPYVAVAPPVNPGDVNAMKKHFPIPTPGGSGIGEKSGPGYKSLPTKDPRPEEKKPYVEPMPKPIPVPPQSAVIKTEDLANNEYVRGALGAIIGWVVKGLCEFLYGVIVPILSFLKEALMRRFG